MVLIQFAPDLRIGKRMFNSNTQSVLKSLSKPLDKYWSSDAGSPVLSSPAKKVFPFNCASISLVYF